MGSAFSWLYGLTVTLFRLVTFIFFREIAERGSHFIPSRGPVIFVAAPHANQFVDPMILYQTCRRQVGFLVAAASVRRGMIGIVARMLGAIPIERPQDLARAGTGRIVLGPEDRANAIMGIDTRFTQELVEEGLAIAIHIGAEVCAAPVERIVSDTELLLHRPFVPQAIEKLITSGEAGVAFDIQPIIDQSAVYDQVHSLLAEGGAIGIFPEGGSHDRAEMLPLKAGVAAMALGAMAKHPELDVKIVPCGLNYFHPHEFRSRAIVEYGVPFGVPDELVKAYMQGGIERREACGKFMEMVYVALCGVTVNVPDYETLQLVQAARRLYHPQRHTLSTFAQLELTRKLIRGYQEMKDHPQVAELRDRIADYNSTLHRHGLRDHQVQALKPSSFRGLGLLIVRCIMLCAFGLAAFPGLLLNAPAFPVINYISRRKAHQAKETSTVKLEGRDVLATWKVIVGLVVLPLLYALYAVLAIRAFMGSEAYGIGMGRMMLLFLVMASSFFGVSYAAVRFFEVGYELYFSIKPLFYSILHRQHGRELRRMRRELRHQISGLVAKLGPEVYADFEKHRIIPSEAMNSPSSESSGTPRRRISYSEAAEADAIDNILLNYRYMKSKVGGLVGRFATGNGDWSSRWAQIDESDLDDVFFSSPRPSPGIPAHY